MSEEALWYIGTVLVIWSVCRWIKYACITEDLAEDPDMLHTRACLRFGYNLYWAKDPHSNGNLVYHRITWRATPQQITKQANKLRERAARKKRRKLRRVARAEERASRPYMKV